MFSQAPQSVCISHKEEKKKKDPKLWNFWLVFHGLVPAGSFTPHGSPCVRQSRISITTGLYVCVCQRGGEKGVRGRRVMRDKRIFSGLPQRGRAGGAGEGGGEIFLPMMHGSDNVPVWTLPEAYAGFVCVCVPERVCVCI